MQITFDAKEDSLQWLRANNGKFTIKSAYRHFDRPAEMLLPWPWKMIWKINVPHKVLSNCRGISRSMPRHTSDFLACWNREGNTSGHKERWKIVPACIRGQFGRKGTEMLQNKEHPFPNHSKALRMKWLWKYANDKHPLWRKVIKAKYEEENRWMTTEVFSPYGVNLWRSIRPLWDDFKIKTKVKVRNGEKTSFREMTARRRDTEEYLPDIHNLMLNQEQLQECGHHDGWEIAS
ncbi:hypothetical protein H5410_057466 [Solanum commersonii]|uniref:Uncharacterized protein n=1 Tax=Solanum commersonii TaxID=4109 RepID=A0A9J5WQ98_SOLCO|nr:hypothetical protein H5410_057466 [Solanum commersonii]